VPVADLVFLDESGVTTALVRRYARAEGGRRAVGRVPAGHWTQLTVLSALSLAGLGATMTVCYVRIAVYNGNTRRNRFDLQLSTDGATWTQVNATPGLSTYYFGRITPDPGNPDVLYVMGQSIKRTQDGGKTFTIIKGAPGGDDYHHFWVNPKHPDH